MKKPIWIGLALLPVLLVLMPAQALLMWLRLPVAPYLPVIFHRVLLRLIGVRVRVSGAPLPRSAALLCANHVSWLDISVLGAQWPLSFVAKSEVARWPLIGTLARLQRTLFIDRSRRSATAATKTQMMQRLAMGDRVVVFAEGTSSLGNTVLPFKSSLIGAVTDGLSGDDSPPPSLPLVPVALAYKTYQNLPMGRITRALYAWSGDTQLWPHLLFVMNHGQIDIEVLIGEPIWPAPHLNRKHMSAQAQARVKRLLAHALMGR